MTLDARNAEHMERGNQVAAESGQALTAHIKWRRAAFKWVGTRYRRAMWQAHCAFPNSIRSPHGHDDYSERDGEKNLRTRLPDDEALHMRAIWATEVYGPVEIDSLYTNLQRLGWDKPRVGSTFPGVVQWIRDFRIYGHVGNCNIGVITRKNDRQFHHIEYFAQLPEEVDYLLAYVYQFSPTLTCVRIGFVLKQAAEDWYAQELALDRSTTKKSLPRRWTYSILGPGHLKKAAIDNARERYRKIATSWFSRELPGFFSNARDGNRLPTAEFITTEREYLFEWAAKKEADDPHQDWKRLVLNHRHLGEWTSSSVSSLQISDEEFEDDARYHVVITLQTKDLEEEKLAHKGGKTRHGLVSFCEDEVGGILVCFASIAYLQEGDRIVKLTRERLRAKKGNKNAIKVLDSIRDYFVETIGQPAIARELLSGTEHVGAYIHWCEEFSKEGWPGEEKKYFIRETLRGRVKDLAHRFIEDEAASREQFEQISSILNTKESIKAQRRMEWLTVLALLVSFASLIAALLALSEVRASVGSFVEERFGSTRASNSAQMNRELSAVQSSATDIQPTGKKPSASDAAKLIAKESVGKR
ncbi:hypothetical protein [Pseudoduganella aquatica]|uniref:hypothetical protein n=1 Tax=Pseudoduganella aquatica TaxID=2660641 RepID=UPI001E4DE81B|nr:hypothetical protein [Pseudoduganella aquatica]